MLAMGRNDRDKKLLSHGLRNAFRKAISRVSNTKITVHPRSLQCWAIKRSTFLPIILSLTYAIPAFPQANGPSALGAVSAAASFDPSLAHFERSQRRYLLGDWGGRRTSLAEKGVTFDFFYISDMQANPTGGRQQTQAGWERARGTIDINFDRLLTWQGLSFHATGLWQSGADLGAKIGTLANPSALVSAHTTRLDSFWLQQLFLNKKLRVRAGQLAGLDFYGNQEYGDSWLIEPMGYAFGNLFSATYESFNPAGTPGMEVRFAPTRTFYIKSAVMSGNRNPYEQDPTGFHFQIRDAPDFLFETGYLVHPSDGNGAQSAGSVSSKSYPGVYKFGGAYNGGKFPDPTGRMSSGNYLIYGMASQAVFRSDAGSNRGLDATLGFDWSPGDVTRENSQITAGVRFNAPFPKRRTDRVACALVYSRISDPFRNFGTLLGAPPLGSEKAVELNYSLQVTPYFLLQPTFQYYINVGGNPALSNAPVLGFRTKVTF